MQKIAIALLFVLTASATAFLSGAGQDAWKTAKDYLGWSPAPVVVAQAMPKKQKPMKTRKAKKPVEPLEDDDEEEDEAQQETTGNSSQTQNNSINIRAIGANSSVNVNQSNTQIQGGR